MELRVNDYVRTKDGFIAKLIEKDTWYKFDSVILEEEYPYNYLSKELANELIIKSSPNIIDLIEVGDYVNGYLVKYVNDNGVYIDIPFVDSESIGCNVDLIRAEDIKSIVTKERFASMEYRIGE